MELFYKELQKRDVVNIADGSCLGKMVDLKLRFPEGVLTGIVVPGKKKRGLLSLFDKTTIFIEECKIVKIGGDVILVNLKRADFCAPADTPKVPDPFCKGNQKQQGAKPPLSFPCGTQGVPPCPPAPPCPPVPPVPPCPPRQQTPFDGSVFAGENVNAADLERFDLDDY